MSGTPTKTGSRVALIIVIIPILAVAYLISPLFLPRWRWENMSSWEQLATKYKQPVAKLQQEYQLLVRYKPRADGDPMPWQILTSTPLYDPENDDEHRLVRISLISDRTGEPPSTLNVGSANYRDVLFRTSAWRFPPGAFGQNRFRPVVVYQGSTFEKCDNSEAYQWENSLKEPQWFSDDEEIEDGFKKPDGEAAE